MIWASRLSIYWRNLPVNVTNSTADTVLRRVRYFGDSPQFWLGLQMDYDLDVAEDLLGNRLDREIKVPTAVA